MATKILDEAQMHIALTDVVTILFNISALPLTVAQRLDFNYDNFQDQIMAHMDEYKQEFEAEHKVKWEYSSENIINCYKDFVDNKVVYS